MMAAIATSPLVPGVSIIPLASPFGVQRGSLMRHWHNPALSHWNEEKHGWSGEAPKMVWYEFVLRNPTDNAVTAVIPVDRAQAAQIMAAAR